MIEAGTGDPQQARRGRLRLGAVDLGVLRALVKVEAHRPQVDRLVRHPPLVGDQRRALDPVLGGVERGGQAGEVVAVLVKPPPLRAPLHPAGRDLRAGVVLGDQRAGLSGRQAQLLGIDAQFGHHRPPQFQRQRPGALLHLAEVLLSGVQQRRDLALRA